MKTLTSITAAALAAVVTSTLIAGTAHAQPPTDWSALKVNQNAAGSVRQDADRGGMSKDQRRSQGKSTETCGKSVDVAVRFGTPNRY
jgi:hypothetical protein